MDMYSPYQQSMPMQQFPQFQRPQYQPPQRYGIVKLNGRNGAEALAMQPNDEVIGLDMNSPILWLIQTDGAGYKTIHAYNISEAETKTAANYDELLERIEKLEGAIFDESNTGKNNKSKTERS